MPLSLTKPSFWLFLSSRLRIGSMNEDTSDRVHTALFGSLPDSGAGLM
jgi:hypothetical protein